MHTYSMNVATNVYPYSLNSNVSCMVPAPAVVPDLPKERYPQPKIVDWRQRAENKKVFAVLTKVHAHRPRHLEDLLRELGIVSARCLQGIAQLSESGRRGERGDGGKNTKNPKEGCAPHRQSPHYPSQKGKRRRSPKQQFLTFAEPEPQANMPSMSAIRLITIAR